MQRDGFRITASGSVLRAQLSGELDNHTVGRIREKTDEALFYYRPSELELDFSLVEFMDSSALALILGRLEIMKALSGGVRLVGISERHLRLLKLSGIERMENLKISLLSNEEARR